MNHIEIFELYDFTGIGVLVANLAKEKNVEENLYHRVPHQLRYQNPVVVLEINPKVDLGIIQRLDLEVHHIRVNHHLPQ